MDNIQINRLNPDTFEYQTYDVTDESLIAISNLDTAFTASTDYIEYYIYDQSQKIYHHQVLILVLIIFTILFIEKDYHLII
jgi:hypothetical protein